jgi:hypothetical protein
MPNVTLVQIDKEALGHIIQLGQGPYVRDGNRFWHKENHEGPATCVGCACEEALKPQ